jgi:hypothetical protein
MSLGRFLAEVFVEAGACLIIIVFIALVALF